jgi:hypothetical protein
MYCVSYPSAIDNLMYVMVCTRPYITYAVGVLSKYMPKPRKEHRTIIKRVFRYLRGTIDYVNYFQGRPKIDTMIDV